MELNYTYYKHDNWYVGYLDDYPDYKTQGVSIEELEEMLISLHEDIKSNQISFIRHHGKLKIA